MDKKKDWRFMEEHMPGVVQMIRDRRAEFGAEHVNLCWRRGVLECQPGWFYAREGSVSIGMPFMGSEIETMMAELGEKLDIQRGPMLMLAPKSPEDFLGSPQPTLARALEARLVGS